MANLKREMIELIKNPEEVNKGAEPEIEKVWTVPFVSLSTTREAVSILNEVVGNTDLSDDDKNDKIIDFLAEKAFGNKIKKEDLYNRLPGPGLIDGESGQARLEEVLYFMATGGQSDATKKFLAEKN